MLRINKLRYLAPQFLNLRVANKTDNIFSRDTQKNDNQSQSNRTNQKWRRNDKIDMIGNSFSDSKDKLFKRKVKDQRSHKAKKTRLIKTNSLGSNDQIEGDIHVDDDLEYDLDYEDQQQIDAADIDRADYNDQIQFDEFDDIDYSTTKRKSQSQRIFEQNQVNQQAQLLFNPAIKYNQYFKDLELSSVNLINIENRDDMHKIPKLKHKLEQLLDRTGIYTVQELGKVQDDGGQFLKNIYQPNEIDFDQIPPYTPPSKDKRLLKLAKEGGVKYVMSTSTVGQLLGQVYYLMSGFIKPDLSLLPSHTIELIPKNYMINQRKPITNVLRKAANGIWALDSDDGMFEYQHLILMELGKVLERQYTMDSDDFRKILLKEGHPHKIQNHNTEYIDDDYHRLMKLNDEIMMRSQIDCIQEDQNGDIRVFEIKTRAVAPMRYDIINYQKYLDYEIYQHIGDQGSFEREYYDLVRGAFLKYAFQLKIGRMDGAFISYHNTQQNFGFEYVSTEEINRRIFGSSEFSDMIFAVSSKIITRILDDILEDLKMHDFQMLKLGFYARGSTNNLVIFAETIDEYQEWTDKQKMKYSGSMKDEIDYYRQVKTLNTNVFQYEYYFRFYVNGQKCHQDDQIQVQYQMKKLGVANSDDYLHFLHEAYQFANVSANMDYSGLWINRMFAKNSFI